MERLRVLVSTLDPTEETIGAYTVEEKEPGVYIYAYRRVPLELAVLPAGDFYSEVEL